MKSIYTLLVRSVGLAGLSLIASNTAHATLIYEGQVDLAGSIATQSSTYDTPYSADRGIDNDVNSFTHTSSGDTNATWWLELPSNLDFNYVRIFNRANCCAERLRDINLSVFDDVAKTNQIYASGLLNPGNSLGSPAKLDVNLGASISGRVVQIQRTSDPAGSTTDDQNVLSLGEVQLFKGVSDANLPPGTDLTRAGIFNMSVGQSSDLNAALYPASAAVDGNPGDFTHTNGNSDTSPAWFVNFGEDMRLESVNLHNRESCCAQRLRDITIEVLDANSQLVFTSGLLNPENVLNNPADLFLDLAAMNGGTPIIGQTLRVLRTVDSDWSGMNAVVDNADDANALSLGEVSILGGSIPEPASLSLLGLSGLALSFRRRCRA
jgi:F5/8 type C domain/PEP-CTERM motif